MPRILSPDMGAQLAATGLLSKPQAEALVAHAEVFPDYPRNRLFLEFQLRKPHAERPSALADLQLEGYGHGYSLEQYAEFLGASPSPLPEVYASALRAALARDPFLHERGLYVEWRTAGDPDWVEYDWSGAQFLNQPAVFFNVPSRYQALSSAERVRNLERALSDAIAALASQSSASEANPAEVRLFDFLETLRAGSDPNGLPLTIYRLGLSDARAPGWVKLILSDVQEQALRTAFSSHALPFADVFGIVKRIYRQFGAPDQVPIMAASIDAFHGVIGSVDVECPYFNGIDSIDVRRDAVRAFVAMLEEEGYVLPELGALLGSLAYREFQNGREDAVLWLNHFKFGLAGRTMGRLKLYFELFTRTRSE